MEGANMVLKKKKFQPYSRAILHLEACVKIEFSQLLYVSIRNLKMYKRETGPDLGFFLLRLHASYGAKITKNQDPPGMFCLIIL